LVAEELEQLISRAPEQWHLLQPNWPSDPGYPFEVPPTDSTADTDA
jgi:KDO2-lipid IV(A) lauroyltransferase